MEIPLEFGVGSPKRRKKNFFALKHLIDPTNEIKKNIYSILLERGGFLPMVWKIPYFFFRFLLNPSLNDFISHWIVLLNSGSPSWLLKQRCLWQGCCLSLPCYCTCPARFVYFLTEIRQRFQLNQWKKHLAISLKKDKNYCFFFDLLGFEAQNINNFKHENQRKVIILE